jgi:hypothetical protein
MTDTTNLGLPLIAASQAQKHVTHNEAVQLLDTVVQLAVLDANRTSPPATPAAGERHIVAASASGAWSGKVGQIAIWQDGAWTFLAPKTGWRAWCMLDTALLCFDGSAWRDLRTLPLDNLSRLGINTAASSSNLLAVKSNAALFTAIAVSEAGSGDVRLQLSKESAAKTASLIFSDAFSGRAEFGLAGDDDFRIKVIPDGAAWFEALRIARATGRVTFPATPSTGGGREVLAAARTYYVRSDGSDANPGLSNTSAGAFLTIQKAVETICALDLSTYQATVQIADGTYTGAILLKPYLGALPPIIQGNASTPSNVVVSTSGNSITNAGGGIWQVNSLKIVSGGISLFATSGGTIRFQNIDFGASSSYQIYAQPASTIMATGNYIVSGSAQIHAVSNGYLNFATVTVTYPNAVNFSLWNYGAGRGGVVDCFGMSFVNPGNVSGSRYSAQHNGVMFTAGSSATFLPGSTAGTTGTGGIYV